MNKNRYMILNTLDGTETYFNEKSDGINKVVKSIKDFFTRNGTENYELYVENNAKFRFYKDGKVVKGSQRWVKVDFM